MSTQSKDSFFSTMVWWIGMVVGLLVFFSLASQLWEMRTLSSRLEDSTEEIFALEEEKQLLEKRLIVEMGEEFQEKQIREQLSMSKPGEVVLLLPIDVDEVVAALEDDEVEKGNEKASYAEQWMGLLF